MRGLRRWSTTTGDRFVSRKQKMALLRQGRKLKGNNVCVNEHLTKKLTLPDKARFLDPIDVDNKTVHKTERITRGGKSAGNHGNCWTGQLSVMAIPGRTAAKVMKVTLELELRPAHKEHRVWLTLNTTHDKLICIWRYEEQPTRIMEYEKLGLKTFEFTEHKLQDMENDIDPENNFYNSTHNHCEYYTEYQ